MDSGAAGSVFLAGRLLVFAGHPHGAAMAHTFHRAAAHRELPAGFVGNLRGPGFWDNRLRPVQHSAGSPLGHPTGPDPDVQLCGDGFNRSVIRHPWHQHGEQLQTHGELRRQKDLEDARRDL